MDVDVEEMVASLSKEPKLDGWIGVRFCIMLRGALGYPDEDGVLQEEQLPQRSSDRRLPAFRIPTNDGHLR
jgi:hypothetical protein